MGRDLVGEVDQNKSSESSVALCRELWLHWRACVRCLWRSRESRYRPYVHLRPQEHYSGGKIETVSGNSNVLYTPVSSGIEKLSEKGFEALARYSTEPATNYESSEPTV